MPSSYSGDSASHFSSWPASVLRQLRALLGELRRRRRVLLVERRVGKLVLDGVDALADAVHQRLGGADLLGQRLAARRGAAPPRGGGRPSTPCPPRAARLRSPAVAGDHVLAVVRRSPSYGLTAPSLTSHSRSAVASIRWRSCEIRITAPGKSLSAWISDSRLSMSRWLVGSSRMNRFGPSKADKPHQQPRLLAARQILGRRCSSSRSPGRTARRARAPWLPARPASAGAHARRRFPPGRRSSSWCCAKIATFSRGATVIVPVSGFSRPASSLAKVDLPLPLAPSSAMRSSASMRSVSCFRIGLPACSRH